MTRFKVGAQLIIWGKRRFEDLPGVLDEVKSIGYEGIETSADALGRYPNIKELLEAHELALAGIHMGIRNIESVEKALNLLKELDGHYLIFSGAGTQEGTREEYARAAKLLEKVARMSQKFDVVVCYHNHYWEIQNNALGIRTILEETDPQLVYLCVDTYWVKFGGLDPLNFIKDNLDRIAYLHLKDGTEEDMRARKFCELGRGIIDFPSIIELVKGSKVEWLVVEQDRTDADPKRSMEISLRYLREILSTT